MTKYFLCLYLWSFSLISLGAVSVENFFQNPDVIQARLSPSGDQLATIKYAEDHSLVIVKNTNSLDERIILNTLSLADKESKLHYIDWIDNRYLAARFSEGKEGIRGFIDTQKLYSTIIIDTHNSTPKLPRVKKVRTKGALIDSLPKQEGLFIYSKSLAYSKLYKVNVEPLAAANKKLTKFEKIDGGQFTKTNEIFSLEGYVIKWFLSEDGNPTAALAYNAKEDLNLIHIDKDTAEPVTIKTWTDKERDSDEKKKVLLPLAAAAEPYTYYCLDNAEEDERNIYKVNFKTDHQELIYTTNAYKILDLIFSSGTKTLIGVQLLVDGEIRNSFFNTTEANSAENNNELKVDLEYSSDGQHKLTYVESYQQAGQYQFHTVDNNNTKVVAYEYVNLKEAFAGKQITGKVMVEGLSIPYILNTPSMPQNPKPFPLIVMPHGGPIGVYDNVYFDLNTQFFVANGYAVLRVNFRGSGGYSEEFETAGKLEWGRLMLADIQAAAVNVANLKTIDSGRVCLFGASYGGYAATMLAIKHPDFYQCAVNVAGVSDLNLLLENSDDSLSTRQWHKEQLISDSTLSYTEQLNPLSPVYLVPNLALPLLVIHGSKDKVVDPEHAHRLRLMLEKHDKPHEWLMLEGAKHSNNKIADVQRISAASLKFINKHTGLGN